MGLNECIKLDHIISNRILKIPGLHILPVTCICVTVCGDTHMSFHFLFKPASPQLSFNSLYTKPHTDPDNSSCQYTARRINKYLVDVYCRDNTIG